VLGDGGYGCGGGDDESKRYYLPPVSRLNPRLLPYEEHLL
jgi:hypothetical protein